MTLFNEADLDSVPVFVDWTITQGDRGPLLLTGMHSFHERNRVVAVEVSLVDPLRWVIGTDGGYGLSGLGTGAVEKCGWLRQKSEEH
jgi:hypothetical protein